MRRVVSLYLPTWPTDRIRRRTGEPPRHEPLVTVHTIGSRRVYAQPVRLLKSSVCMSAWRSRRRRHSFLICMCVEAVPDEDEASLRELARWAIGYSPVVAPDPPEGSGSILPG